MPPKAKDISQIRVALIWDNFGPMHVDRCEAVAVHFGSRAKVYGVEIGSKSEVYGWNSPEALNFTKVTIFKDIVADSLGLFKRCFGIINTCIKIRAQHVILCHYDVPATLVAAIVLRLMGRKVYAMGCSKFDDYTRSVYREVAKSLFYAPYDGGLSSGTRSRDYMRFLGVRSDNIHGEYNTVSTKRIQILSDSDPAPAGTAFQSRHFTIIARLVPKKNVATAIIAYARLISETGCDRTLQIYGDGILQDELATLCKQLGVEKRVYFNGFATTEVVSKALSSSLCLVLPSIEEQFGNVVIEALCMGVPVLISENCGARDNLIRTAVNGFFFEPDNPVGLTYFLKSLSENEALWRKLCYGANEFAARGDVAEFAKGVERLVSVHDENT